VLIRPISTDDGVFLPPGADVLGTVKRVRKVGLGLIWERARLELNFDTLVFPDGEKLSMQTHVVDVENAREGVRPDGKIQGIRATASPAYRASGLFVTISTFDPLLMLFAFISSSSILRFPDSEIYYPAGTELELRLTQPLPVAIAYPPAVPSLTASGEEKEELTRFVATLPFRTRTLQHNKPSDITNLIFLGTESQIEKAFAAAGWSKSDELNAHTRYRAVRAVAELHGYAEAPMSVLTLDEHIPHLTYQKSLNTISKRHHLRIWDLPESWKGKNIWTAAATRDIGATFSKKDKHFIHLIEHNTDNERSKIVDDLVFSSCVDTVEMVDRPYVPHDARNSTGDPLLTDGRIAVLRLNDCDTPLLVTESLDPEPIRSHGNLLQRGGRQLFLSVHNDLIRSNVAWQAYEVTRFALRNARRRKPRGDTTTQEAGVVAHTEEKGTALLQPHGDAPALSGVPENTSPKAEVAGPK
jgi:hypothetical protein